MREINVHQQIEIDRSKIMRIIIIIIIEYHSQSLGNKNRFFKITTYRFRFQI